MTRLVRPRPAEAPDYWVLQYEDLDGRRRSRVLGHMDKSRAREERVLFEAELVRRRREQRGELAPPPPPSPGGAATLDDFLRGGYLHQLALLDDRERGQRLRTLGHLRRLLPDATMDALNAPTTQRGYLEQRKQEGASWNTRRLEVAAWNELLRDAAARGALSAGPTRVKNVGPRDGRRYRFLEPDEIASLRGYMANKEIKQAAIRRLRAAVEVGLHCGLRPGEITSRRWSDFDLERGRLTVGHAPEIDFRVKRDQVRVVPLPDELIEVLREYRGWCGPDATWFLQRNAVGIVWQICATARAMGTIEAPVCTADVAEATEDLARYSATEEPWAYYVAAVLNQGRGLVINQGRALWAANPRWRRPEPIRVRTFSAGLRRAAQGAGIAHVWPHALRHSWASLALTRGVPLHIVQAIGGWKTPHVLLEIYAHVHPDRALEAVKDFRLSPEEDQP